MATFPRVHWGRILIGGFLAEGTVLTFVLANFLFFAPYSSRYAAPSASMLACFLFAFWVGQRVDVNFALHGALVGVVAVVIQIGLTLGHHREWPPVDYIHLYSGNKETLVSSLECIQCTSAEILAAIAPSE